MRNDRSLRFGFSVLLLLVVAACGREEFGQRPPANDDMQFVPGGVFRMGSDLLDLADVKKKLELDNAGMLIYEVPSFDVQVHDFWMDTYDVTNKDFQAFVEANPAWQRGALGEGQHNGRYLEHWANDGPPDELLYHPVTFITWHSAVAYCDWRGKRLALEVEYEWAAQDGQTSAMFPWGDEPPTDDIVSWGGNGIDTTVPVGSYPPNSRGLYDMSGNVWHFVADPWLGSYGDMQQHEADFAAAFEDPDVRRVVRGGSWGASAVNLRVRYRDSHRPYDAREMVGFRCAKSAGAESGDASQEDAAHD